MAYPSLPPAFIDSLRGIPGFDEQAFLAIHEKGPSVTSVRFNPHKPGTFQTIGERQGLIAPDIEWTPVPWCKDGWRLSARPSFIMDPAWHAGLYYVQEASSMFLEQVFLQHAGSSGGLRVLDACAAPGGKSTHLQALMGKGGLLVSNEVIRTRVSILSENLQRWGGDNTVVTSNDPRDFSGLPGFFDVLMVDAPCSGSGLFRREPEAIGEWSSSVVQLCSQRQERILADLWGSLKQEGLLIYSTCSYSTEEDEEILDWLCRSFVVESLPVVHGEDWGIVEVRAGGSGAYGYRFFPNRLDGEGFFIAVLRKKSGEPDGKDGSDADRRAGDSHRGNSYKKGSGKSAGPGRRGREALEKGVAESLAPWLKKPDGYDFLQAGDTIRAIPSSLSDDLAYLSGTLHVRSAGVAMGQWMRTELIPDPALALSSALSPDIPRLDLTREQALAYVRKDELRPEGAPKGWALVTYGGQGLGWVKVLAGRVNNYYPKQWRVLKR